MLTQEDVSETTKAARTWLFQHGPEVVVPILAFLLMFWLYLQSEKRNDALAEKLLMCQEAKVVILREQIGKLQDGN